MKKIIYFEVAAVNTLATSAIGTPTFGSTTLTTLPTRVRSSATSTISAGTSDRTVSISATISFSF